MRHLWEVCPTNPNYSQLHIDRRVPDLRAGDSLFSFSDKKVPPEFKEFIDGLLAIPGVESVSMRNYQIGIVKGSVFPWEEIEPAVEVLVRERFYPEEAEAKSR